MQLLSRVPNFDFMGRRRITSAVSGALIIASLALFAIRGLNFGIDFTGGVMLEFAFEDEADLERIRAAMAERGYADAEVQAFGGATEVLVRIPPVGENEDVAAIGREIEARLRQDDPSAALQGTSSIDSEVGDDLTEQGGLAMLFALILIFGYVMLRFRWKFAAGAIIGLVHDVIITLGFLSAAWLTFDLSTLAAVLTVIGYSLNDTIVVFDRIRENFRMMRRGTPVEVINTSINQTLARTLMTGVTALMVLVALLILGGQTLATFSIALIVGIVVGTYSTIYVASVAALALNVSPQDMVPPKVEEIDSMP